MVVSNFDRKTKSADCIWFEEGIKSATHRSSELEIVQGKLIFTSLQVAQWMKLSFERLNMLNQLWAATRIKLLFGGDFSTNTGKGGYSISRSVREEFKKLTFSEWDSGKRIWKRPIKW